jgi:carboxymethylenebutenolidase
MTRTRRIAAVATLLAAGACSANRAPVVDEHAGHDMATTGAVVQDNAIPAGATTVKERLAASPRHGEWAKIAWAPGSRDSLMAWVVYPEKKRNAPVVVVIHEIFGLSTWVRGVADQLAADGYIAVAPDLLSRVRGGASSDELASDSATKLIRGVPRADVNLGLLAAAQYGMALPAAQKRYGVVGFCWGGSASFNHAVFNAPNLRAAVVYYGTSLKGDSLAPVTAPVLGLYGENDARVDATIPATDSTMKALKKTYQYDVFKGAGHGFLRAQDAPGGANLAASQAAWPRTIAWFRKHLGA